MPARPALRAAVALVTATLVVTASSDRSGSLVTAGRVSAAGKPTVAGKECGCPPMPVVATSKERAKGHVKYEMTVAQIEKAFSNRHAMFAGGWEDAMVALAHDLDPAGGFRMWDRPRPAANPRIPLEEGTLVRKMLNPGDMRDPRNTTYNDPTIFLLHTLARINKYGEPEHDLRAATLSVLRFLADDLGNIPVEVATRDPRAMFLRTVGQNARGMITRYVSAARPTLVEGRLGRGGAEPLVIESQGADLKLDVFDLANAGLDVYWAIDDQKRDRVLRLHDDDRASVVGTLAAIASARSVFGGRPVAGPAQEAVACRAFSTLATFADTRLAGSRATRDELFGLMVNDIRLTASPHGNPSELNAARAAFLWAGIADQAEADARIRTLVDQGEASGAQPAAQLEAATTLRALPLYAGGPDRDTFRGYLAGKIGERFDQLQRRQDARQGGPEEQRLIDAWKASAGRVALANPSPPCGPEPGEAKGRIVLYGVCADGLQVIDELYVGVATVVEVQFDAESERKETPVEIAIGGQTLKLTARRYDDHGRIFRTEPIVPAGKTVSGPIFNPAPPPKPGAGR